MKIRIRGQSLRFRVGRSEVERLARGEMVHESIDLAPDVRYTYVLQPTDAVTLHVTADGSRVVVNIPEQQIAGWAGTDEVGIHTEIVIDSDRSLAILIEKDFACIDKENGESQEDAFPNPSAAC